MSGPGRLRVPVLRVLAWGWRRLAAARQRAATHRTLKTTGVGFEEVLAGRQAALLYSTWPSYA